MSNPVYLLWRNLIQGYSSCALTKPEDRLPAFAGIAKLFQEITGDEYLAGLWRSRFLDGLDWRVREPQSDTTRSYRAPSWSWASVNGPIKPWIPGTRAKHLATLVNVKVTPRGSDPTGAILSGSVTLLGVLTRARKTRVSEDGSTILSVASRSAAVRMYLDSSDLGIDDGAFFDCLPLNVERNGYSNEHSAVQICILALLISSNCTSVAHRRIGHFILEDTKSFDLFGLAEDPEDGCIVCPKVEQHKIVLI